MISQRRCMIEISDGQIENRQMNAGETGEVENKTGEVIQSG